MIGLSSIWAYPWDLHDIEVEESLALVRDAGMNMVSLATSYHAGRFLQPGNPRRRVYFPEDGTVYYRPDPAVWAGHGSVPRATGAARRCLAGRSVCTTRGWGWPIRAM